MSPGSWTNVMDTTPGCATRLLSSLPIAVYPAPTYSSRVCHIHPASGRTRHLASVAPSHHLGVLPKCDRTWYHCALWSLSIWHSPIFRRSPKAFAVAIKASRTTRFQDLRQQDRIRLPDRRHGRRRAERFRQVQRGRCAALGAGRTSLLGTARQEERRPDLRRRRWPGAIGCGRSLPHAR